MIFHEVELSHTKEIMDSYEVNPIIAKYVEHRGFTKEDYEALNIPFYYNFTDLENGETVVNLIKEACASKSKIHICIMSTELHHLLESAMIFLGVLMAKGKSAFEFYDGPQDDFGSGLHIILGDQLEVRNGNDVYPLVPGGHYKDEDVAQSLLVLQLINTLLGKENQYLASLAGIGIQAEGTPLRNSNRYHLKKTLGLLNDCRFDAIEFIALTPKTRQKNNMRQREFKKTYNEQVMADSITYKMAHYLESLNNAKKTVKYLIYGCPGTGKFRSVAPIADEINAGYFINEDYIDDGTEKDVIPLEISDLSKTNIEEYLQVLSPFGIGQEKTLVSIEGLKIHSAPVKDYYDRIKLSFFIPNVGGIDTIIYTPGYKIDKFKQGQTVKIVGTLSINDFTSLMTINAIQVDILD
ncbi:hypothetical protein [Catenibacterium mitsuokai]|uniref:RecJ OB domain-containing protein n=1 Tax=Catenibacterium mitsuokai TaxID=100886 RepID=A0AAW4N3D4_9FIRM|nr:hypothetical protein [Catenibacterium mitsuokai]MBV3367515.1 hypothetical protein [Catenibacterium mitsuokai]MBV3371568.1 hypothetical protein [Catenibacterium mitsuokai]MBV3376923.1 hypothetical protein [Catenibacterium mitsuokai]MBV3379186.1 hypothetical protein [Catenibacterium mitsuokai]MBV3381448.1 hypothetical protein [Catenibacterium mitsuokai]